MRDEEFVSKTISDGSVDLEKFPTSKVRQLAKKLESSKATACHIKQVAGDPQAAQINLLRHQRTELPAGKYKKKRPSMKPRQSNNKNPGQERYHSQVQPKKKFDTRGVHNDKTRCSKCGDSVHVEGFQCPVKKYQCKACHKFGHFTCMCFQKKQAPFKHRKPKAHQMQAGGTHVHRSASYDHIGRGQHFRRVILLAAEDQAKASQRKKGTKGNTSNYQTWHTDCNPITIGICT